MFNFFSKTDQQLQHDVINELSGDPRITENKIAVSASDGVITLRGTAPHYFEKVAAEQAARRVGGVRAVVDVIEVKLLDSCRRNDDDIARAARLVLGWHYALSDGIKVTVNDGWVSLNGEVYWEYERLAAYDAVSALMGVRGVTNGITLIPKIVRVAA